jgi:membrane-associated phospholipid phosphatase
MYWFIGLTICLSTLLTKQHYFLDVFGGALFAAIGIIGAGLIL